MIVKIPGGFLKSAVVAIGGNALLPFRGSGNAEDQMARIREASLGLVKMVHEGYRLAITHGNGPQVGNILLQNEEAKDKVPPMPLDVCVAQSQAQIGYMLQQALRNELSARGIHRNVTSIITQVVVDPQDEAFKNPTKPVGPYYTAEQAKELMKTKGWKMIEDKRGGYRRVVPSPMPLEIVEKETIRRLLFNSDSKEIVVVAGGGGIPVIRVGNELKGVEAVIDKDLASSVLATDIEEKLFVMLTDVPKVSLNFRRKDQRDIDIMNVEQAREYVAQGHFPAGSMGPKIEAAILFLQRGGEKAIVTNPPNLEASLRGQAGTTIIP